MRIQVVLASRLVTARKSTPEAGPETSELVKHGKVSIDIVSDDNLASRQRWSIYNPRTRDHANLMMNASFLVHIHLQNQSSLLTISQFSKGSGERERLRRDKEYRTDDFIPTNLPVIP